MRDRGKINTKMDYSPAYLPCLPFVFCIAGVPASARSCFSVAASLFYFAFLHKKVGLANLKACQAEVFSPKKRRLELTSHQLGKTEPGIRFFRFSYVHAKKRWNLIIIYWIEAFYKIRFTIQEYVTSLVRSQAK